MSKDQFEFTPPTKEQVEATMAEEHERIQENLKRISAYETPTYTPEEIFTRMKLIVFRMEREQEANRLRAKKEFYWQKHLFQSTLSTAVMENSLRSIFQEWFIRGCAEESRFDTYEMLLLEREKAREISRHQLFVPELMRIIEYDDAKQDDLNEIARIVKMNVLSHLAERESSRPEIRDLAIRGIHQAMMEMNEILAQEVQTAADD